MPKAWSIAFTDNAKALVRERSYEPKSVQDFVEWISKNANLKESGDPIPKWTKRLASLVGGTDEHKALKQYCDFMTQTQDTRDYLLNAGMALDQHIEEEIDRMRGL